MITNSIKGCISQDIIRPKIDDFLIKLKDQYFYEISLEYVDDKVYFVGVSCTGQVQQFLNHMVDIGLTVSEYWIACNYFKGLDDWWFKAGILDNNVFCLQKFNFTDDEVGVLFKLISFNPIPFFEQYNELPSVILDNNFDEDEIKMTLIGNLLQARSESN